MTPTTKKVPITHTKSRRPGNHSGVDGDAVERAVLLYDGACGFCSRTVQFILRHERHRSLRFASLGGAYAAGVLTRIPGLRGIDSVVWLDEVRGDVLTRSSAILRVTRYLGVPWRLAVVAHLVPPAWRDHLYDFVARHRHALTGGAKHCLVPPADQRHRFLDENPT